MFVEAVFKSTFGFTYVLFVTVVTHIHAPAYLWGTCFQTLVARTPSSAAVIEMILSHLFAYFLASLYICSKQDKGQYFLRGHSCGDM